MLKSAEIPVLIVPADTVVGRGIKTIVLTTDLEEVQTIPAQPLYQFLDALPAKLLVVNVKEKEADKFSPELGKAITDLRNMLEKYDTSFNYISGNDIVDETLDFAKKERASLIMAVHHKRGLLSGMFHKSITKKLAYNSSIPLLILPAVK